MKSGTATEPSLRSRLLLEAEQIERRLGVTQLPKLLREAASALVPVAAFDGDKDAEIATLREKLESSRDTNERLVQRRCQQDDVIESLRNQLAEAQAASQLVAAALDYLHPHLDAGTFAAPDWAVGMASILTGGKAAPLPVADSEPVVISFDPSARLGTSGARKGELVARVNRALAEAFKEDPINAIRAHTAVLPIVQPLDTGRFN